MSEKDTNTASIKKTVIIDDIKKQLIYQTIGIIFTLSAWLYWASVASVPNWIIWAFILWLIIFAAYSCYYALPFVEALSYVAAVDLGLLGIVIQIAVIVILCAVIPIVVWLYLLARYCWMLWKS